MSDRPFGALGPPAPVSSAGLTTGDSQPPKFVRILTAVTGRLERVLTVYGASLVVALVLLFAAAIYTTPRGGTANHGDSYKALSITPFNFKSNHFLQLRILTPALAHYLHLRDNLYPLCPLLTGAVFMAAVYCYTRKRGFSGAEATGMAAMMAFSTPLLHQLHMGGYVDTTSFLLVFLALITARWWPVWPVFYALSLLNHESCLFMVPLLLFAVASRDFTWWRGLRAVALCGLAVVPMALFRNHVQQQGDIGLSHDYYLSWEHVRQCISIVGRYLGLGVFMAFKLFWVFAVIAIPFLRGRGRYRDLVFIVLAIGCAHAQLLVATDTSRLLGLAFPAIIWGALAVREKWGPALFERRLWILIGFNLLVPQYYIGQSTAIPFLPLPVTLLLNCIPGMNAWGLWWT